MLLENKMGQEKQRCANLLNFNFFKTLSTKIISKLQVKKKRCWGFGLVVRIWLAFEIWVRSPEKILKFPKK